MEIFDNLKKLIEKENRGYFILFLWLIVGNIVIQTVPKVGIFIFLPFLTFLMFLFLLSFISKKDIREIAPWKVLLLLIPSIPFMFLISVILVVVFAVSIISYLFITSWFILYGVVVTSKKVDNKLHDAKLKPISRSLEFFGGSILAFVLLFVFLIAPSLDTQKIIFETPVPIYLNYVYLIIGIVLLFLIVVCIILMFKKSFNAWYGIFAIIVASYSFYLVLKIFLGLNDLESSSETSIYTRIGLIIADVIIIVYAISTLLGSKANVLANQLKYFGIDTVFIWLLLSKASFEFVVNLPYETFKTMALNFIPFFEYIHFLNNDVINLSKNILVLAFFIILVLVIGLWEIRKYNRRKWKIRDEVIGMEKELISTDDKSSEIKDVDMDEKEEAEEKEEHKEKKKKIDIEINDENLENDIIHVPIEKIDDSEEPS